MQLDPSLQAAFDRVGPLASLVDDLTDFIDELMELPTHRDDPRAALLMRPRAYRMAARVEEACYLLNLLCYRLPRNNFSDDPVGYFIAHRNQFERIVPTLGMTSDPDTEMLKAILAGRN